MESCLVIQLLIPAAVLAIAATVQAQSDLSGFSLLPSNITARISFPARFDCQVNEGFIRWAIGRNQMLSDSNCLGCEQLDNDSLYIPTVTPAHEGLYTCFVVGVLIQPRIGVYLTVAEAPTIVTPPTNITVSQNETLKINVNVTGVPQPSITWRKDGVVINDDPRFTITGPNLSLSNAQYSDAGEYTITAHNIADTAETNYNVIIQFLPVITIMRNPDSDMVEENVMVTVTCLVTSNPQSTISWEQVTATDKTDTTDRAMTQVLPNNGLNTMSSSSITFTNDDINGFSKFCCSASNSIGPAARCLNFTETGTPPVPTDFRLIGDTSSSSASVSWASSTNDVDVAYKLSWTSSGVLVNSTTLPSITMSYTIEGLDADTEYELMINAINTQSGQLSSTLSISVRTLVAVPGEVVNFIVEVLRMLKIFRLTWEAPEGSPISHYIIYMRTTDNSTTLTVLSNTTSYDFPIYQENVVYEFAIQAVNVGGSGPMSNYMAVFHCSTDPLLGVRYQRFSHSVNVFWNLTSKFDSNGIYLTVRDKLKADNEFIAPRIPGDESSLCIDNLNPNTDYSITVFATFNCDNVSESVDFRTLDASSSEGSSSLQDCVKYDPPQQTNDDEQEEEDSGLEAWAIALIVVIPIISLVVMLSIGIFCALKMRSLPKDHGGLPMDNNAATYRWQQEQLPYQHQQERLYHNQQQQLYYHNHQQQLLNQHQHFSQQQLLTQPLSPRNNSASSYPNGSTSDYRSGSNSPTRSAVSSNGRPFWQSHVPRVADEQSAVTQV